MAKTQWYFLNNKMRILHYWKYAAKIPKVLNPFFVNWIQKSLKSYAQLKIFNRNEKFFLNEIFMKKKQILGTLELFKSSF